MTFGDKVIEFNKNLDYKGNLPEKFSVLNPYLDNPETIIVMQEFYKKYYNDNKKRKFIIGINPSRHGAGVTGVPFTDTKRLESVCGIKMTSVKTHEVSSVFIYDLIEAFGGAKEFYSKFYINSPFPLAIVKNTEKGVKNANYYDEKELFEDVKDFMIESLKKHISLGLEVDEVFVLGKKNSDFINNINKEQKLFGKITVLEHPRYIEQYKSKEKKYFIEKYLKELKK
ncbi:SMUG2 DNA glycosylase family protein [Candidatus Gracilibacteria bacterium]|nr:MAG: SMUG2 DNA glycosylase family protein [Candidatus Gracilibacteria bacterium]